MTDRFTVRAVVCFLGVITMLGIAALWHLVATTEVRDAALLAILAGPTGTALGALATLLARTGSDTSQPVHVVNSPTDAVPTVDVKDDSGVTAVELCLIVIAAVAVLWACGVIPR